MVTDEYTIKFEEAAKKTALLEDVNRREIESFLIRSYDRKLK